MGKSPIKTSRKLYLFPPLVRAILSCTLSVLLAVFGVVSHLLTDPSQALAATGINQQMNFQGRLLNGQGAVVADGYYNIQFKIYQDGDGQTAGNSTGTPAGTLKWTENYLNVNTQGVLVRNGFLSVQLGSVNPFANNIDWNQDTLWLSMNIAGTNASCANFAVCSPDGEMTPMKRLSANAYALYAANANQLGGLTSDGFIQNSTMTQASSNFNISGNGVIGGLLTTSGLVTANGGLTASGAGVSLNNNSNFAVNIATGTSTGAISLGSGLNTFSIDSTALDISTTGALSGVTSIAASGAVTLGDTLGVSGQSTLSGGLTVTNGGNVAFQRGSDFTATGTTNNANFGSGAVIRLNGASAQTITGIANGVDGRLLTIINAGSNAATLNNSDSGSTAGNRIITGTGTGLTVPAGASITLVYDSGASVWRVTGSSAATGGAGVNTIGTFNGSTSYANGAQITGTTLTFGAADGTNPGMVSTGAQTIAGAKSFSGLITGSAGLDASGAAANLNANSNFAVNIATGTSTGLVSIGGGSGTFALNTTNIDISSAGAISGATTINASGAITGVGINAGTGAIQGTGGVVVSGAASSINANSNFATNINTGTSTGLVSIGGGSGTFALNTTNIDVSAAGAITGATGLALASGNISQTGTGTLSSGTGAISLNGATSVTGTNTFSVGTGASSLGGTLGVTGLATLSGGLTVTNAGNVAFQRGSDFSTTGTTNNASLGTGALVRLSGASAQTITGITGGVDGRILSIINAGSTAATLTNNDAGSTAANRIITGTGSNLSLPAGAAVSLIYDAGASFWRIAGTAAATGGAGVNTVGTFSGTSYANGAQISGTTITFGPADGTNPGMITTGSQNIAGAKSFSGLVTGTSGLTVSGAVASLNASSNFATNINTGTSTGLVSIGGGSGTFALDTTNIDISSAGAISGATGITSTGTVQGGTINATSGFQVNGVALASANLSDSANIALLNATQTFSGANSFSNAANSFTGVGTGLTALNATNLASGTVDSARITGNYTGITGTGALATGSIATGFGTISTGNTITTTSSVTGATINAVTGYQINGANGATVTCGAGQFLQSAVIAGGITTSGTCTAGTNGVTTVGTIDSQTKSTDGAVIIGTSLYLQTADTSNPGVVSTGSQTFSGAKTFNGLLTGFNGLGVSGAVDINVSNNAITNIATGTTTSQVNIGGGSGTFSLNTTNIDISSAGAISGATAYSGSGNITTTNGVVSAQGSGNNSFSGSLVVNGNANVFKPTSDSTTSFQIQPSGSATSVFNVDTINSRIGVGTNAPAYTLDVTGDINSSTQYRIGGNTALTNTSLAFAAASAATIQSAPAQALNLTGSAASSYSTTAGALTMNGFTGVNLQNNGTTMASISSAGLTVSNAANVAFQRGTDFATTGTTNNANLGTGALVRLTGASAQTITGITGGTDGRLLTIINAGTNAAVITNNDTNSTAANRIITGTNGSINLPAGATVSLVYDAGASFWRIAGTAAATGGAGVNTIGTFNGATSYANGALINGTTLTFGAADVTNAGLVNTGTQTIGGVKSFTAASGTIANLNTTGSLATDTALLGFNGSRGAIGYDGANSALTLSTSTTNKSIIFSPNNVEAGRFDTLGNFGIQVGASPLGLLDVNQNSTGIGTVTTNGTTTLTGDSGSTDFLNTFKVGDIITVQGETVRTIASIASDTSLTVTVAFATSATGRTYVVNGGHRFVVLGNGNVGVGTSTPGYKLDVQGGDINSSTQYRIGGNVALTNTSLAFAAASAATIQSAASQALNLTGNNASSFSTTAGALTMNGFTGVNLQANGLTTASLDGTSFTIAANKNIVLAAGTGTFNQTYNNTTGTAATINANPTSGTQTAGLNVNAGGAGTVTNGVLVSQSSGILTNGLAFSGTIGTDINRTGTLTQNGSTGITLATNAITRAGFDTANNLYLGNGGVTGTNAAPTAFTVRGTGSSVTGVAGGVLAVQGGNATAGNANGGNLNLSGGTGFGTGTSGLVVINTPTFQTASVQNCTVSGTCVMSQANIDGNGAVLMNVSATGVTVTMADPTVLTAGRIVYVTSPVTSTFDFTLSVNGGTGNGNLIAMRPNTTATMVWNGSDWTAAGASSSTTLQAAYDNTLTSAGGAELLVSNSTNANGLTIRDSLTSPVNGALLEVQTGSAATLFSVNSKITEYAANGGAETQGGSDITFPASQWVTTTGGTAAISRNTTALDSAGVATGQGAVKIVTTNNANDGVMNDLPTALNPNTTYNVSFAARLLTSSTTSFNDMNVQFSRDGTNTGLTACTATQAVALSVWTKVNCTFKAPASGITTANSIIIRQTAATVRTFYVDNLSVTIAADFNYATDGNVNSPGFASWAFVGAGGTAARTASDGFEASDSATATITNGGTSTNSGLRNTLSVAPLVNTLYRVTVYGKLNSGAAFSDFKIQYSRNGTATVDCKDYNTQTLNASWAKITCYVTTDGTAPAATTFVNFLQTAAAVRTFSVDAFSMTLASDSVPNVQVGGGALGGPTTLFTLDKGASAPIAANNDALLGSMYYDTTLGKLQCYEADGWGACGSSPDNIVTISPEYTNAVLNGTGVGTMTSDLCSGTAGLSINTSICAAAETYNFYRWTSPQPSAQSYSIYVTYQLPTTFKSFNSGSTSLMGRTDSTNSTVTYQIYKNDGTGLVSCGTAQTVSTGIQTSWQTRIATGSADPSTCSFAASNSVVFKITTTANSNANAYVGNLNFSFSNK